MAEASTVALVILVLAAGYAAIQLAGTGDAGDGEGVPAGVSVASPSPGELIVPPPSECTVEPLAWEEIEAIAATQAAGSSTPRRTMAIDPALRLELDLRRIAGLLQVTGGEPADEATIGEVQDILNEFVACANVGGIGRGIALMSEDFFGVIGTSGGEDADAFRAEYEASPTPRPREQWIGYHPIVEARAFYSGHVVIIQPADVNWLRQPTETIQPDPDDPYLLVSFITADDRWVIDSFQLDEARDLLEQRSPFPEQPTQEAREVPTPTLTPSSAILVVPPTEVVIQPTSTVAFRPSHRSNAHQQVNLRAGPGTEFEIVGTLTIAQPLHYLNEDAPADDPARDGPRWMKFRTEDGQVGWVREIDVDPIDSPMPTPVG